MPPRGTVFVPSFAHGTWATGVNDRFAYGDRDTMFAAYTSQLDVAESSGGGGNAAAAAADGSVVVNFNNGAGSRAVPRPPLQLFDGEQSLCSHLRARGVVVASSNFCLVRHPRGFTRTLALPLPLPLTLALTLPLPLPSP